MGRKTKEYAQKQLTQARCCYITAICSAAREHIALLIDVEKLKTFFEKQIHGGMAPL